jgi:hypothetical protein
MPNHALLISQAQYVLIPGVPGHLGGALSLFIFDDTEYRGEWDAFISGEGADGRSGCIFAIQLTLLGRAAHEIAPRTPFRHSDYLWSITAHAYAYGTTIGDL